MKKKSDKQKNIDRIIAKSKQSLILENDNICMICGRYRGVQLAHLLPKSIYPEYYLYSWNHALFCHDCHELYDNDVDFRKQQDKFYNQVFEHDEIAANKYFRKNG